VLPERLLFEQQISRSRGEEQADDSDTPAEEVENAREHYEECDDHTDGIVD
jgi:hypothetical protein